MGIISSKLRNLIRETKNQKVVDIQTLYAAQQKSAEDLKSIKSPEEMGAGIDPAHAAYAVYAVYASVQNFFAVFAEDLSTLRLFDEYTGKMEKAMDTYEPSYPPMSPVTCISRRSSLTSLFGATAVPVILARKAKSGLSESCRRLSK